MHSHLRSPPAVISPCFATRLGGVSGNKETRGWRASSHTAMVGAGEIRVGEVADGTIVGCCARAASGHAAAPPNSVMNSRRLMPVIGFLNSASPDGYVPMVTAFRLEGSRLRQEPERDVRSGAA